MCSRTVHNGPRANNGWRDLRESINFYKKNIVQLSQGIKNIYRRQVITIAYTLEKRFFAVGTFEGLWVVSFQVEWKNLKFTRSAWFSCRFPKKIRPKEYCLWELNLFFYIEMFSLELQSVSLSWKIVLLVFKLLLVFLPSFVADTKKSRLYFCSFLKQGFN